jgi:hypothetical protein
MIAQAHMQIQTPEGLVDRSVALWGESVSGRLPTQAEFASYLRDLPAVVALLLLLCGVVYMVLGWKAFKILVVANAAILGAFLGRQLGGMLGGANMPLFAAGAGALVFGVLSWPMMKAAVSIMAALAGGLVGAAAWSYVTSVVGRPELSQHAWVGAVLGVVTLGLLSFVIFKIVIMIFTSIQGAMMCSSGGLALAMMIPSFQGDLYNAVSTNAHLLMLIIGVPAVIGFALQYNAMSKKAAKKRNAAEGG